MLEKIQQAIQQRIEKVAEDAQALEEGFGDPLARETDWTPAKRGGTHGRSRRLKQSGSDRLTFQPTLRMLLFYAVPTLAGAGILIFQPMQAMEPAWLQSATGLIFLIMGLALGYRASKPVVIDKQLGLCWSGWAAPKSAEAARDRKGCAALDEVRAIQVIPERLTHKESVTSYEINLVLADASRLNLVDHSRKSVILEDAQVLGKFLDVPVWDASGFRNLVHPG